jgi:hypothetical protein
VREKAFDLVGLLGETFDSGCYGVAPTATGRSGSDDHADHEPAKSDALMPAIWSAAI